jgi:hypothetical protein
MSFRISKIGGALVLATSLLVGAAETVKAAVISISPGSTASLDLLAGGANVFNSFQQTVLAGPFTQDYFFSLITPPLPGVTTATVLDLTPQFGFGIANFTLTWFNPNGSLLVSQQFTDASGNFRADSGHVRT